MARLVIDGRENPVGLLVMQIVQMCALLLTALQCVHVAGEAPAFSYNSSSSDGPEVWGSLSCDWMLCSSGLQQSPINIQYAESVVNQSMGSLGFSSQSSQGVLVTLGHTVKVELGTGAGQLIVGGDTFTLKQFHFHVPSEHTLQNQRFPLEMQMVHETAGRNKIAVISIVFWKDCHNTFLDQFWNLLPSVSQVGSNVSVGTVSFDHLHIGPSYARYMGSLTTPPCDEAVTWLVDMSQWNTISEGQLQQLVDVMPDMNARPLQSNNGRTVQLFRYMPTSPAT